LQHFLFAVFKSRSAVLSDVHHQGTTMKKALIVASLITISLAACGKKEEAPAPAPAPAAAPAPAPEPAPAPAPAPAAEEKKDGAAAPAEAPKAEEKK
jgi:hypothetical protein